MVSVTGCYITMLCLKFQALACMSVKTVNRAVGLLVCLFVSNKRHNAQILCGTSHDPREGHNGRSKLLNCVKKFMIFVKF